MVATLIDGQALAKEHLRALKSRIRDLGTQKVTPHLVVFLVGNHGPSHIYVDRKCQKAKKIGLRTTLKTYDDTCDEENLVRAIESCNQDPDVHGILVQLPLPEGLSRRRILASIDPQKDVDGLTPLNMGLLQINRPYFMPCTPKGCLRMIQSVKPTLQGSRAVVIGRSELVGRPMATLLTHENCTVTMLHRHSKNPWDIASEADILVVAAGQPHMVDQRWIKPKAIVIDVGIHRVPSDEEKASSLVGDVNTLEVMEKASFISPVPGGVGPMTIASLMDNCVIAAERATYDP